ncbi:MAG: hypothetical protein EBY22_12085, partial [Gammaproteobacteria bacterium]|nr:hypothetical protein [Gammaproteobacteria bacterium]
RHTCRFGHIHSLDGSVFQTGRWSCHRHRIGWWFENCLNQPLYNNITNVCYYYYTKRNKKIVSTDSMNTLIKTHDFSKDNLSFLDTKPNTLISGLFTKINYSGYDINGQRIARFAEGFHARVLQHEYDHLDGILYPMRIKDLRYFGFEEELYKR